jgi:hypothetical protein
VETRAEGRLLARTIVGWGGDAGTAWAVPFDPAAATLHGRTLALALAARATLLRRLALAARGAATLGALLAPGGALLALPAAWRFIGEVVDEVAAARGGGGSERTEEVRRGQ